MLPFGDGLPNEYVRQQLASQRPDLVRRARTAETETNAAWTAYETARKAKVPSAELERLHKVYEQSSTKRTQVHKEIATFRRNLPPPEFYKRKK